MSDWEKVNDQYYRHELQTMPDKWLTVSQHDDGAWQWDYLVDLVWVSGGWYPYKTAEECMKAADAWWADR